MEDQGSGSLRIEKLNNTNFYVWKQKIQLLLALKEVDHYLVESGHSAESDSIEHKQWLRGDNKARAIIGLSLSDEHLEHVRDCETAKDMWEAILNVFERHNLLNKLAARRRFYTVAMQNVALGVFLDMEVSFLSVGHTHTHVNQAFSVVSRILSRLDTAAMAETISAIDSCYLCQASAVRLDKVANFSGLCERSKCLVNASSLGGLMNLRYFRFTRAAGDMLDDGVFQTQWHVKFQCMDDWQPLSVSSIKGILKQVLDLRRTPPTETFPTDNVVEINKCLESIYGHS